MPLSKSSRSSKSSRPSLLSLPSVTNLLTVSHEKGHNKSVGHSSAARSHSADSVDDESGAKPPQRRKSKMNVLTSFFTPNSSGSLKVQNPTSDPYRPKPVYEALPPSHIREKSIRRKPVASTVEYTNQSSVEDSPKTSSNLHDSVFTADNSPGAGLGPNTPATQASDFDFGFGRTHSPEATENGSRGKKSAEMPALQKHNRGPPQDVPPQHAPPPPPKIPLPQELENSQVPRTPVSPYLSRPRSSSAHPAASTASPERTKDGRTKLHSGRRPSSPAVAPRMRSSSAQPPSRRNSQTDGSQDVSKSTNVSPVSKQSNDGDSRGRLRRSWLPGGRSRSGSKDLKKRSANKAWILSPGNQAEYNTLFLTSGEKVPELWNENGTVLVYLFSKASGKGPSFKISAQSIEASIVFHELIQGELESSRQGRDRSKSFSGRENLMAEDAERWPRAFEAAADPASDEVRLYIPPPGPDHEGADSETGQPSLERLIAMRNLFAFLTGQPLVGTKAHSTIFSAFLEISALLKEFDFMSMDGTTWGEGVDMSFGFYVTQLALADVRYSREKTLEAIVLGERMKCWDLYNEAFTHAVGKWQAIVSLKSPLMKQVSAETFRRLERANLDLLNRQDNVNSRLEEFEFPALFAGVASTSEFKEVRFGRWRSAFSRMRSFTLGYYKALFGAWPPKARSKKNPFSESGLNRLVLKALYADLSSLYDLLVDRDSLTPRVIDQAPEEVSEKEVDQNIKALRKLLSEFDQSSPPVLPPIPFDIPKIPTMKTVQPKYDEMKEKGQAKIDRKIKEYELQLIMHKSYNFDTDSRKTPFLQEFKDYDLEYAKGKNQSELLDHRIGTWLFLYVVIQSLPLLSIDAPDLRFSEGVEYFLCQPPMGNPPWLEDAGEVRKAWYQIPGSQVQVELSADVVMFSVEATFERSHCWGAAKMWEEAKIHGGAADLLGLPSPPFADSSNLSLSPLEAPRPVFEDMDPVTGAAGSGTSGYGSSNGGSPANSRPSSPSGVQRRAIQPASGLAMGRGNGSSYRSSFTGLGSLEPLATPMSASADRRSSRLFSAQIGPMKPDYFAQRPRSAGGLASPESVGSVRSPVNLKAESSRDSHDGVPAPVGKKAGMKGHHDRNVSSTFDDILKDMGNQQNGKAKKKFGF